MVNGEFTLDGADDRADLKIIRVLGNKMAQLRMLQMGITPGTSVEVLRRAPLADPVEICVRGSKLLLRREEARNIAVVRADTP